MHTQLTFENLPYFAENCEEDEILEIPPATNFLPDIRLKMPTKEILNEQILLDICNFLQFERSKILSETLNDAIKELCVARLCQALGVGCAFDFKNEFFNFFSCIMGEVVSTKLGHNLGIDEYHLKFIKVENVNLIYAAATMIENPNLDEAFIDVYNLANKFKHLIFELKKN